MMKVDARCLVPFRTSKQPRGLTCLAHGALGSPRLLGQDPMQHLKVPKSGTLKSTLPSFFGSTGNAVFFGNTKKSGHIKKQQQQQQQQSISSHLLFSFGSSPLRFRAGLPRSGAAWLWLDWGVVANQDWPQGQSEKVCWVPNK